MENMKKLFDGINDFTLTKVELDKVEEWFDEGYEDDFKFDGFDKYFSLETLSKAFDLNKKRKISKKYLLVWLRCYAKLLKICPPKEKYSIIDEIKEGISEAVYDAGCMEEDENVFKAFKSEEGFFIYANHLINLIKKNKDLKITCMLEKYDKEKPLRANYLIIDEKNKKYCVWVTPMLVDRSMLVEPIISLARHRKKVTELKSLEYTEI